MKKRIDIMCDLETLGKKSNTLVFQIAAQAFDIKTGGIVSSFNEVLDITKEKDFYVNGETLLWWLDTDKELLAILLKSGTIESERQLFSDFAEWINQLKEEFEEVYFWANGMLFDNRFVSENMEHYGIKYPIYYRNDRDLRTLTELAAFKENKTVNEWLNEHKLKIRAHDALNDVTSQIQLCLDAFNEII